MSASMTDSPCFAPETLSPAASFVAPGSFPTQARAKSPTDPLCARSLQDTVRARTWGVHE